MRTVPKLFFQVSLEVCLVFIYPILSAWIFTRVFYPGFMSYDTIHALDGARGEVSDSIWPPMVSYVWRLVDLLSSDPSAMHFLQVGLLFVSITFLVKELSKNRLVALVTIPVLLFVPVISGTLFVIWKDVLTSAFLFGALAVAVRLKRPLRTRAKYLVFCSGLVFLFVGIATRHNSITGAVPICVYLCYQLLRTHGFSLKGLLTRVGALSLVTLALLYGGKVSLDNYSLPSLTKLEGTGEFMGTNQILDLAGASICSGNNYMTKIAPNLTRDELLGGFDARHINLSASVLEKSTNRGLVAGTWTEVLLSDPSCLLARRFEMSLWLMGANNGEQFLITSPSISPNQYGYTLEDHPGRDALVQVVVASSLTWFLRPWFLLILALTGLAVAFRRSTVKTELLVIFSSGLLYAVGLFLMGNAADARLLFHFNVSMVIVILTTWPESLTALIKRKRA